MATERKTPIVIGVGDFKNKSTKLEDDMEPVDLMLRATMLAFQDTNLPPSATKKLQSAVDSVDVVATWTWNYPDLPGLLAEKLGVNPTHKSYSAHGGNQPAKLFDEAARRISFGESKVAVVTGGEALASLGAYLQAEKTPKHWTKPDPNARSISTSDLSRIDKNLGTIHSIGLPTHVYPLYENGFRAIRGQSIEDNNKESAALYAEFAAVAENNPSSWNYGRKAAAENEIGTVTKRNRMICFPYPLLMNAFNNINLAGTCLLTSTAFARELGIPESRWIYPLGGAGTSDHEKFWERENFHSSLPISKSLDAGLEVSGLTKDQIDLFDFYSCFPIVPKLACHHLGLPLVNSPKPVTLLGGLTFFGGAGNNYSMHALIEMVRRLREGGSENGLVLANGGVMSYQYVVCLSSRPRTGSLPYPERNPLPTAPSKATLQEVDAHVEGEAVIETYTVQFNRDGTPAQGYVVGRLMSNNHRFLANHGNGFTLNQLSSGQEEPIGKSGFVRRDGERNVFTLHEAGRL